MATKEVPTKKKIVIVPTPMRIESGPDVGIALQLRPNMVELGEPGYDLFDDGLLELLKKDFIALNESRFTFTYEKAPLGAYTRVFAQFKVK
jgi:hypothetical protein